MEIKIIHIVGASGSGTSTLGKAIENELGFKHLDVDDYYWLPTNPPFTAARARNERIELLEQGINKYEKCVISGSLCGWGDCLVRYFDLVIRVITPTEVRIKRLKEREFKRFGSRILPGGDMYAEHIKFINWAAEYDTGDINMRSKVLHDEWLKMLTCKQVIADGTIPTDMTLSKISRLLNAH